MGQLWVWLIHNIIYVANTKTTTVALMACAVRFLAKHVFAVFVSLVTVTARAFKSRLGMECVRLMAVVMQGGATCTAGG